MAQQAIPASPRQLITLYRAVCDAEYDDFHRTGKLNVIPGSLEGKWFAELETDAASWGRLFFRHTGVPHDRIVQVKVARDVADGFFRIELLDGIGPARFMTIDDFNAVVRSESAE
jgi:hypothetical protein